MKRIVYVLMLLFTFKNQFYSLPSSPDSANWNPMIKSSEFAFLTNSEPQKINIRYLGMGYDGFRFNHFG